GRLVDGLVENVASSGGAAAGFGVALVAERDAGHPCQALHNLGELEVLHLAEEAEHVAALPAPEAVVDLLGRADGEGGRLLRMERTQPHQRVAPGFLELEET